MRLSELDSKWVSVLNATTTEHTTGRWLDVLGRALVDDEVALFKKHGDEAAVVKDLNSDNSPLSTAQHRLMFLDDMCKLLNDTDNENENRVLHATFYMADKMPVSYARKVNFDENTMRPLEVALRRKANELFKEHIDLDAVKDPIIEYEAIDEAIELVQLDDMTLPYNDLHTLDPESFKVLREVALIKREFMSKLSYREWSYKAVTGCRMRLIKWPHDMPKDPTPLGSILESILRQ